jgi:hypothetical protein
MSWFKKFRNDHTKGFAAVAGLGADTTSTGPRPGTTAIHDIMPLKADLPPRVDNLHNSLMQVARAEEYVSNCERPLVHHRGPLQASTDGRCKRFVKSAAHKAGGLVGMGRGEVPMVRRPWDTAGAPKPEPLEVLDGTPKYRQLLHLEPRERRQARQTAAALAREEANALHSASRTEYRRAQDKSAATASRLSHAQTVTGWMHEHVQQAQEKHCENLATYVEQHHEHGKMQLGLRQMGERLQTLQGLGVQATKELQRLATNTVLAQKEIERLEQDLVTVHAQLRGQTTHSSEPDNHLIARQGLLHEVTQAHQNLQRSLQAQTHCEHNLAKAKHDMRRSTPFSTARANAKTSVASLREVVAQMNAQNIEMQTHLADLKVRLSQTNNVVTWLEKDKTSHTKQASLKAAILEALSRSRTLSEQTHTLQQTHQARENERHTLQNHYDVLSEKAFEFQKIQITGAKKRAEKSNQHAQDLAALLSRQEQATAALVPAHHEATVRFDQEKTKNQLRLQSTLDNWVQNPPGFSPAELASPQGQALRQQLGVLAARLSQPPVGKTQAQYERGWRMPGEDALAVVLEALDLVCGGDVAQANQVAQGLVEHSFANLVPQPGTDFNGNPLRIDEPPSSVSPLEEMLRTMASLPNGLDMLEHVTAPQKHPANETLKNAVMVYYKATTTLSESQPQDAKSMRWLENAQEAAKCVAHRPPRKPSHEAYRETLTPSALEHFNKLMPLEQHRETLSPPALKRFNALTDHERHRETLTPLEQEHFDNLESVAQKSEVYSWQAVRLNGQRREALTPAPLKRFNELTPHEQHRESLTPLALERFDKLTAQAQQKEVEKPNDVVFNKLSPDEQFYEAALSPTARQAFNGVRNGLLSVTPDSAHHEANLWLQKLGDMFANLNQNGLRQANPLNARGMLVKGAAQVGLPSPENRCSKHLRAVCEELLNLTGVEKNTVRERAFLSNTTGPHLTESVVLVRHLLSHIRDQYDQGKRIDNLQIDAKVWEKINQATAHDMATGAKPKERSETLKELTQWLTPLGGEHGPGLPPPAIFADPQEPGETDESEESLDSDMAARQARLESLDNEMADMQTKTFTRQVRERLAQLFGEMAVVPTKHLAMQVLERLQQLSSDMAVMQEKPLSAMQVLERLHQQLVINPAQLNTSTISEADDAANDIDEVPPPAYRQNGLNIELQTTPAPLEELQDTEGGAWIDASVSSEPDKVEYDLSPSRQKNGNPFKASSQLDAKTEYNRAHLNGLAHTPPQQPPLTTPDPHQTYELFPLDSPLNKTEMQAPSKTYPDDARTVSSSDPDRLAPPSLDEEEIIPKHPATKALEAAQKSAEVSRKFIEDCTPEDFVNWAFETVGPVFGGFALSEGHTVGVSTGGGVGFLSKLSTALGVLVRPIADATGSTRQQITITRTARGLTLVVYDEKGRMWNLGLNAGPVVKLPKMPLTTGLTGSLSHSRKSSKVKGGLVMRSPRAGHVQHAQAIREFGEMLYTAACWEKFTNEAGAQKYTTPIEALLDRHPNVSLGSVDHLNTSVQTVASGVSGFAGVVGPTAQAYQSAGIAVGVGSKRQREKIDYAVTAGSQAYSTQQVTQSSAVGVVGSIGWRAAGEVGPHVQGIASDQLGNQMAGITATMGLRISSVKSNVSPIVCQDGSLIGERQLEFNNFEELQAYVTPKREAWIHTMMKKFEQPEESSESDKRIRCERALNDFLAKSKQNMASGVLLLQEYLDVKPHVCGQLSAYKSREIIARRKANKIKTNPKALTNAIAQAKLKAASTGQLYIDPTTDTTAHALAMQAEQIKLLDDDASYQPFLLNSTGRSMKNKSRGLNLLFVAKKDTYMMARLTHDRYPDVNPNKIGYTKAQAKTQAPHQPKRKT